MRARLFIHVFLLLVVAGCTPTAMAQPVGGADEDLRRLCAILDYVAADYGGAVKDGQILDAGEYKEQLTFLRDATALAAKIPDAQAGVAEVAKMVDDKADPAKLGEAARGLRRHLLDSHGLVLAPPGPPSREHGALLYAKNCAGCHGATGGGDGPQGLALNPRPRSFRDPAVMEELSPARAFNGLTDGIRGTSMPSWGALTASDRWDLAFHVFSLRHDPAAVARGAEAYARTGRVVAATTTRLAEASDGELTTALGAAGLDEGARSDALAWLRTEAPYRETGAPLDRARQLLAGAIATYRGGDAASAQQAAGQAYLDGFEPHEGALRARDAELVSRCEEQFLRIRDDMAAGAGVDSVEREALQLGALLDRAEETLAGGGGPRVAFIGAAVVILREGVEAALLIMLLLGMARRGANGVVDPGDPRAVHLGWMVATVLGVATWFAAEPLVRLGGASRELMEGIVALLAAAALLATGHFVLARLDAKHRVDAMKRKLAAAASPGRRRAVLAGLAFMAVYREAFEVVLFLRAIALDAGGSGAAVAAGAGAGALLLVGVVALLLRLGKRLKPGPLLASMGTLLCVLAVVLAGKGVRALQEAGAVSIWPLAAPRVEWLGFFPTLQGLIAQIVVFLAFFAIAMRGVIPARRAERVA